MYVWIWRHLPGRLPLRAAQALVLVALVAAALFMWVFPRVEAGLPYQDVTVPGPGASSSPSGGPAPSGAPTELPAG